MTPEDIPGIVQWVLEFLNLRSEPGKQNLNKLPADVRKELKCPPLHPSLKQIPVIEKLKFMRKDVSELEEAVKKLHDKTLSTKQWYKHKKKVETFVDNEGNVFCRKTKIFLGVEQCSPTLEDFKQFFLKEGIPPKKGIELLLENGKTLESLNTEVKYPENWYDSIYYDLPFELKSFVQIFELWGELCKILRNMIHGTKTYDNKGSADKSFNGFRKKITEKYNECLEDDEIPFKGGYSKNRGADFRGIIDVVVDGVSGVDSFPHYGMLPQAIYACVLDFSYNHKGILSQLKQCPYCGKFEIEKVTEGVRGRKRVHCSDECRKKFGQADREANRDSQANSRMWKRKRAKKEIIDWLCGFDHISTREEAEKIYEEEKKTHPNNVASLKAFQKTYGLRTFLI